MKAYYFSMTFLYRKRAVFLIERGDLIAISNALLDLQGKVHTMGSGELIVNYHVVSSNLKPVELHRQNYAYQHIADIRRLLKSV